MAISDLNPLRVSPLEADIRGESVMGGRLGDEFEDWLMKFADLLSTMERATGIEPVLPAWESDFSILYFQHLQNSRKNVRACTAYRACVA